MSREVRQSEADNLSENPIENLQDVLPFLHDRLIYLDLSDCPVAKDRRLFEAVCAKCPDLSFFNSKRYTEQQVRFTGASTFVSRNGETFLARIKPGRVKLTD